MNFVAVFAALLAVGALPGSQDAPPSPARPSATPAVADPARLVLEKLDGTSSTRELAPSEALDLEHVDAVLIRVEARAVVAAEPSGSDRVDVSLIGGERAHARVAGGSGDRVALELAAGVRLELEVDEVESLVFGERLGAEQRAALARAASGDRLYWIRGTGVDRVDGTLEGFATEGVRFDSVLGKKTFPWNEVAALFIEPISSGAAKEKKTDAAGPRVMLDGVDGTRLRGILRRFAGDGCQLERRDGRVLTLPLSFVAEVARADGSIAFLADLAPSEVQEGSPFGDDLGLVWPHQVDRSVTGTPLRAGGRTFGRGLGVHSPSRLSWDLAPGWGAMRGEVAIDDSVRPLSYPGSVEFRVLRDGELFWSSGTVRGGEPPLAMPSIPLAGVKRLTLEVAMSENLHVGDRADWLKLLLVRAP